MTTSNEHNNAPAVPQGWKLVPVEPTRAMWAAVNKLDDEMAAGSYDGKGCSIEQAWNCMLDFAPDDPALAATPAPAQEVGLTDEQKTWAVNQLMEQAQVFASAWSLVGGRHDFGNALEEAEQAKTELRSMVVEALHAKGGK